MIGAIKIKDGLFIGDSFAAQVSLTSFPIEATKKSNLSIFAFKQDQEFVVANKVTHIINCAGKQVPNYWEGRGVTYLTF
jgi:hypothetical protein